MPWAEGSVMRPLVVTAVGIALLGASAPGVITRVLESQGAVRPVSASAPRTPSSDEAEPAQPGARSQVEIEAESDGHFYVDAEINLRRVRLMVDTGATVVALRKTDADAAGVRVLGSDFQHPVATANGTAYAAEAELDSVTVSDIELNGVRALILPDEQLSVSLLGGSFLNRLAGFRVENGTLLFEN
jgi:aspartyl protease family protein